MSEEPGGRKAWPWVLAGVAVALAGGGAAGYFLLRSDDASLARTTVAGW